MESGEGRGRKREVGGAVPPPWSRLPGSRNWGGRRGRGDARNMELSIMLLQQQYDYVKVYCGGLYVNARVLHQEIHEYLLGEKSTSNRQHGQGI